MREREGEGEVEGSNLIGKRVKVRRGGGKDTGHG